MQNTETKETDAAIRALCEAHDGDLGADCNSLGNFARKLERERDEAREKLKTINKELGCELRDPNGTIWEHCATIEAELTQLRKDNETIRNAQKSCVDCDAPTLEEVKQLRKVCANAVQAGLLAKERWYEGVKDTLHDSHDIAAMIEKSARDLSMIVDKRPK